MWLLVAREPTPDAPYWPGRRLLAAVDAAVWPLLWVLVFSHAPKPVGLIGPFVAAWRSCSRWVGCTARCGSTTATGSRRGAGAGSWRRWY